MQGNLTWQMQNMR